MRGLLVPRTLRILCLASAVASAACAGSGLGSPAVVPDQQADVYLYTQGARALERGRWLVAREYLRRLVDTYPTSQYRQDAKLGIGDSYLGEKRIDADILGVNEFKEFLRFYPLAARADYAQYRLAYGQMRQVLSPERDQTATTDALREFKVFLDAYPNSPYTPEVIRLQRETRDRMSRSELMVGRHYYRARWYPGTVARLEALLAEDPTFTGRDGAYFYLAEAYVKVNRTADAKTFYQKVLDEFRVSEYREEADKRLALLANAPPVPAATPATPAAAAAAPPAPPPPDATSSTVQPAPASGPR
jgi:outer membrane assembly lipoprotein YfiO